jgi:toxin-antitoxin system PIN domain toxin
MHAKSKQWLENCLSEGEPFAFDWTVLLAFLRISTRAGVFPRPLQLKQSFELIDLWLNQPCALILEPTSQHSAVLLDLLLPLGSGGNLISDAHLAALTIEHGATLYSADIDFSRFPGLNWINPLESE